MGFTDFVHKAIRDQAYPGAAIVAVDKNGNFLINEAFGKTSTKTDAEPFKLDTMLQVASMTKLLTTIAVLQLVEKGLVGLDDDVAKYIPEYTKQGVLLDVDADGKPTLEPLKTALTLRHLLTHSAGTCYDGMNANIIQFRLAQGRKLYSGLTLDERYLYPPIFQPGSSWMYGSGLDWAGRVLERITGETLDSYMKKFMFPQLGIKDITFFPNDEQRSRLSPMSIRSSKTGELGLWTGRFINDGVKDCWGGQGCYATMTDYIKVLASILADDEKLLKRETTAQMFQPQLTRESKAALQKVLDTPEEAAFFVGDFPVPGEYDWGLGGILVQFDNQGRRKKGTMIWSGMPNCYWFIDRTAGVAACFGTQVMPPGDAKVEETLKALEYEVNARRAKL